MRPIILFILFTCISCAKETDFLFEREINYSRLDSFVHEPDRMHYIIMPIDIPILNFIGSEGTIAVKMLKNELSSKFNSEEDQLRGSYSFFQITYQQFLILRKFKNFKEADRYVKKIERSLTEEEKKVVLDILPVTQDNYRVMLRKGMMQGYKEFYLKNYQ